MVQLSLLAKFPHMAQNQSLYPLHLPVFEVIFPHGRDVFDFEIRHPCLRILVKIASRLCMESLNPLSALEAFQFWCSEKL